MTRVSQGKLDDAKILYNRYHIKIYNFFLRLTFNRDISLDLTQNVFYRLLKYRATWKKDQVFIPWIFRIARNEFNDYMKREGKFLNNSIELDEINDTASAMTGNLENSEQVIILQNALSMISPEHRQVLLLSRYMKLKNKDIAYIINSNENAVKQLVFRAIQKLREVYFKLEDS